MLNLHSLLQLFGCFLILECAFGFELNEESVRNAINTVRHVCPAQMVTGPQKSIYCNNPEYFEKTTTTVLANNESDDNPDGSNLNLEACRRDLGRMLYTLDKAPQEWALRMVDAMGKPSDGIMEGNVVWPGDYTECLEASAPELLFFPAFKGRYCLFNHDLTYKEKTLPLSIGVCFPDSCDEDSLANLTHITKKLTPSTNGQMGMTGIICQPMTIPWDAPAIVMLIIIAVFVSLSTVGTLLTIHERLFASKRPEEASSSPKLSVNDMRTDGEVDDETADTTVLDVDNSNKCDQDERPSKLVQFLKCFCVITNGAKILDTSNKAEFRSVHGIRFLSMSWVILGHSFAFVQNSLIASTLEVLKRIDTLAFEVIPHGVLAVDSFFLLSGFLLTYLFLREADKRSGKISWVMYYFHRYWRLTPVYAIVLGFDYALTKYVGDGPLWPSNGNEEGCKENWWWNLLYINNFNDKQCMGWSWFLANDMQFYVISPLILYPLWTNPKVGLSIISSVMLGSWICSVAISWNYEFFAGIISISEIFNPRFQTTMAQYFLKLYIKPYTRIGPYLVGMILGFILHKKKKDQKFRLSLVSQVIGWFLSAVVSLTIIYGLHHANIGVAGAAFYNALAPSLFTAALAWVIFTCVTGNGGVVDKILSHSTFVPLSRLTYCAYLVHPIIIVGFYQSLEKPLALTYTMITTLFIGFLVMSYMAAFIVSLLLEAPFMAVEKMFIKKN